jgi:Uma2 family endonuclease
MESIAEPVFINKDEEMSRNSHSYLISILSYFFFDFLRKNKISGSVHADADIIFPNSGVRLRPDLSYFRQTFSPHEWEESITHVPELIVEILSDSSYLEDTFTKKHFYASEGVAEYWIVSSSLRSIIIYNLHEQGYMLSQQVFEKGLVHSKVLTDFSLEVSEIFNR